MAHCTTTYVHLRALLPALKILGRIPGSGTMTVLLLLFLNSSFLVGQEGSGPSFRSTTEIVLVPAIVTKGPEGHLSGLKKQDFAVFQNGKRQDIAFFEEVTTSSSLPERNVGSPNEFTNTLKKTATPKRLAIIVFDTMRTPFQDQVYARHQLIQYLASIVEPDQSIALYSLSLRELKVIHDFTTDPKVLVAAVAKVKALGPETVAYDSSLGTTASAREVTMVNQEAKDLLAFRNEAAEQISVLQQEIIYEKTRAYLHQLARAFAGVPGRKSVIWVASAPPNPDWETIRMLNDSQMAIYPVDARGLTTPEYESAVPQKFGTSPVLAQIEANQNTIFRFRNLAEMTGGRAYFNRNDLQNSFREAVNDSAKYYLLGFYIKNQNRKVGWQQLTVKVSSKGAQVRTRSGFLSRGDPGKIPSGEEDLKWALSSPLTYTEVQFEARLLNSVARITEESATARFQLVLHDVSGLIVARDRNHLRMEFVVQASNQAGMEVAQSAQRIDTHFKEEEMERISATGTLSFENQLDLPPGQYKIKFVAFDTLGGRLGTLTFPLDVGTE
jgi:VWFA-related protein